MRVVTAQDRRATAGVTVNRWAFNRLRAGCFVTDHLVVWLAWGNGVSDDAIELELTWAAPRLVKELALVLGARS